MIFNILPVLREKSTGLKAAARRVPSLSQAPGALEHGAGATIIITDTSKHFCVKQRENGFDNNKPLQLESLVFKMNILPL